MHQHMRYIVDSHSTKSLSRGICAKHVYAKVKEVNKGPCASIFWAVCIVSFNWHRHIYSLGHQMLASCSANAQRLVWCRGDSRGRCDRPLWDAAAAAFSDDLPSLIATASAAWTASHDIPALGFVCTASCTDKFFLAVDRIVRYWPRCIQQIVQKERKAPCRWECASESSTSPRAYVGAKPHPQFTTL